MMAHIPRKQMVVVDSAGRQPASYEPTKPFEAHLSGKPIEGFAVADSPELFGDEIERVVQWSKGNDVHRLAGKPIRLRFVIKDADLYSFQFQPRPIRNAEEHEE